MDPHHVRLPGAHHRRLHRRHEAEREGPALSRSAHPALQRHDPEKHEPPLQPRRAAGRHRQAAPRDPEHHPPHYPHCGLPG